MGSPRQGYWSGLLFPPPGDLPDPGIEPLSPALAGGLSTAEPPGKSNHSYRKYMSRKVWSCPSAASFTKQVSGGFGLEVLPPSWLPQPSAVPTAL